MNNTQSTPKSKATPVTLERIRAMSPNRRRKFFAKASPQEIEAFTDPCYGDAHTNAFVDGCGVCLNVTWGRMLKPE
jgi:hypothetical protein